MKKLIIACLVISVSACKQNVDNRELDALQELEPAQVFLPKDTKIDSFESILKGVICRFEPPFEVDTDENVLVYRDRCEVHRITKGTKVTK